MQQLQCMYVMEEARQALTIKEFWQIITFQSIINRIIRRLFIAKVMSWSILGHQFHKIIDSGLASYSIWSDNGISIYRWRRADLWLPLQRSPHLRTLGCDSNCDDDGGEELEQKLDGIHYHNLSLYLGMLQLDLISYNYILPKELYYEILPYQYIQTKLETWTESERV